ncbi:Translationally-controlled tumor protein [Manis javanica]|nr:Translationally-controlled tumor protein [Manis javanica]
MIIYWDLISHDDMFSNINKIQEIVVRMYLEVEGKMVSRTEGNICDLLTVAMSPLKALRTKVSKAQKSLVLKLS